MGFSPRWHEYRIEAVSAACRERNFDSKEGLFYVCYLQSRALGSEVLAVTECMTPWKGDGQIPLMGLRTGPVGEGASATDAVYAAREEYRDCDEWDGPQGMKFILLETGGCGV